jgi:hypothetical protein
MSNFNEVSAVSLFMISLIGVNKRKVLTKAGADWNWVASEVWRTYPGVLNEFLINDAIDFIFELAEIDK